MTEPTTISTLPDRLLTSFDVLGTGAIQRWDPPEATALRCDTHGVIITNPNGALVRFPPNIAFSNPTFVRVLDKVRAGQVKYNSNEGMRAVWTAAINGLLQLLDIDSSPSANGGDDPLADWLPKANNFLAQLPELDHDICHNLAYRLLFDVEKVARVMEKGQSAFTTIISWAASQPSFSLMAAGPAIEAVLTALALMTVWNNQNTAVPSSGANSSKGVPFTQNHPSWAGLYVNYRFVGPIDGLDGDTSLLDDWTVFFEQAAIIDTYFLYCFNLSSLNRSFGTILVDVCGPEEQRPMERAD